MADSNAAATFAKGLEGIVAGETQICSIEQGGLWYRGYEIHDLAQHATFEEVAHVLLIGHKPSAAELAAFKAELIAERPIPASVSQFLKDAAPQLRKGTAVPMDVVRTGVSLLAHLDADCQDNSPAANLRPMGGALFPGTALQDGPMWARSTARSSGTSASGSRYG